MSLCPAFGPTPLGAGFNIFVVVSNAAKPPVGRGHCDLVRRTDWRKMHE
jgi:hypothetical protein